jgi:glutamine synthetase
MSTEQVHATNEDGVPVYPMKTTTTVEAVMQSYQEAKAEFVSLLHVGTDGWIKSLDFTPFSKDHLRDILTSGERADGSSLFEGSMGTQCSDICMRPRLSTAFIHPFTDDDEPKGICVLCDHLNKEGTPLDQSPSTILQKAQARVTTECSADGKLELYALGEVEYFLGRQVNKEECSKTLLIGNIDKNEKGYHSTSPFLFGTKLRRRAMEILTRAGYHAKYGHGEVGFIPANEQGDLEWEQHEIEMSLMPLQQAADAVLLCQWILRNLASQEGYSITFDPMVSADHAGNGLHFHMSATKEGIHLHHYKDGVIRHQNHPVEEHKNLHRETQALIAGLCLCGGR